MLKASFDERVTRAMSEKYFGHSKDFLRRSCRRTSNASMIFRFCLLRVSAARLELLMELRVWVEERTKEQSRALSYQITFVAVIVY